MVVYTGKATNLVIHEIEGLDGEKDNELSKLSLKNVGSSYLALDTSEVYKLNTESDNKTLKWYKL